MNGWIFDCKRFAVHDGPGIRTTLFLKGCMLRCPWCQNPEGLDAAVRLWWNGAKCVGCQSCAKVCATGALRYADRVHIDQAACTQCGACVDACPALALTFDGECISSQEATALLLRDRAFYEPGGVTLSGGEVFAQWPFALEVLGQCRDALVDTAIETCLYVDVAILKRFIPLVDHFIVDIKYFDAGTHARVLGVDNRRILDNYKLLVDSGADVLARTPLIPGYTETPENIRAIARFLAQTNPRARYELINFNPLCRGKYASLERAYPVSGQALSEARMAQYTEILREEGIFEIVKE